MAPYDSESSGDEDDYTETNVMLGYASKEPTGDTTSHLGGQPTWLDEQTAPSGALAKCNVCNDLLSLLLELNGDLPEHFPGHERRLYVWACRRKTCRRKDGSVRAIRGVRIAKGADAMKAVKSQEVSPTPAKEEKKAQTNLGDSIFGVKSPGAASPGANPFANPFSSGAVGKASPSPFSPSSSANPFSSSSQPQPPKIEIDEVSTLPETFASKARIGASTSTSTPSTQPPRPHEPWPPQDKFSPPYPHFHLDADYETLDAPSAPEIPSNARMDIDEPGAASSSASGKEDKEAFESTLDKTFQKFADRIGQNAEQILRYEFKGEPLLYSRTDAVGKLLAHPSPSDATSSAKVTTVGARQGAGFPRCQNCGADRVFEMQLTPHAITELEVDEMGLEGMEWGTIIMGVCSKDCKPEDVAEGQVGYLEEWVGVQWEELNK